VASRSIGTASRAPRQAQPRHTQLTSGREGPGGPCEVSGEPMPEGRELTWDDTRQGGYQALVDGEALYEEMDAEQGRCNIDVEKHLRRVELKLAQTHAWFAMARELGWQRDDSGSGAR
jgi:hypothetical protein